MLNFASFSRAEHEKFAEYVERFCRLFRADVFLPKLFQRIVDAGLVDMLPKPPGVEDIRYFIWDMDSENVTGAFRVDRAIEVFKRIGVVKTRNDADVQEQNSNWMFRFALIVMLVWIAKRLFF